VLVASSSLTLPTPTMSANLWLKYAFPSSGSSRFYGFDFVYLAADMSARVL
jgi:hypothetical protein